MSLEVKDSVNGRTITILTYLAQDVRIGVHDVTLQDFMLIAEYVLINTDLIENDPRIVFLKRIENVHLVDGWAEGKKRLTW